MKFTLTELAACTGGALVAAAGSTVVEAISIDSRTAKPGDLFVALVAERDGHEFVDAATLNGAVAAVVDRRVVADSLVVPDTLLALQAIGSHARTRLPDAVIAITGSVGKTSTKDLLASILRTRGAVGASSKSFNNEIGVPLVLANSPDDAWAAVIEMGARGVGHIAALCRIARPTVGVITNIGVAHLGEFGSVAAIAAAKGELVESLPAKGTAVLNHDDPETPGLRRRSHGTVLSFGESKGADVRAEAVTLDGSLRPTFVLCSPLGRIGVRIGAHGRHQVANALAASAAAIAVGATLAEIVEGLAEPVLSPARMDVVTTSVGAIVINDAYNANPVSMRAGLRAMAALTVPAVSPSGRRVAVLGTMAELGPAAEAMHLDIAALASELGVSVIAVAEPRYGPGAIHVRDHDEALRLLGPMASGDIVLVKGSLVAGLQVFAERLIALCGGSAVGEAEARVWSR